MPKTNSKQKIEKSIDGILGGLTIRGRASEEKDPLKEIEELKQQLASYKELGSLESLRQEKEQLVREILSLKKEQAQLENVKEQRDIGALEEPVKEFSLYDRDKHAYQPSAIIRQYCEQSEGKRKLTIHLREIEYQAILKAAQHLHTNKGQIMDTITRALRFYIPNDYYLEAEREVSLKAVHSVRSVLEGLGFSQEEIEKRTNPV